MPSPRRLTDLVEASRRLGADLDLDLVLHRIVASACSLVGARYGALGVLAPGGGSLDRFVTVGVDDMTAAAIGRRPVGRGLLGAVGPDPVRLADLGADSRAGGFPPHHPPMASFLGVPVRVRGEVFGTLYLAEADAGVFTAEDEQVVAALASTAGIAVDNARAARRQHWLEASSAVTRQLLAVEGEDPLALIARQALTVAAADVVTVVLPTAAPDALVVEVAAGAGASELAGTVYPRADSLVSRVLDSAGPLSLVDASGTPHAWHQTAAVAVGPAMVLPLVGATALRGALAIGRMSGRPPFDAADLEMAGVFAHQAAIALELADARAHRLRAEMLEDRDRIARDLHDHVVQRLFALGLTVDGALAGVGDAATRDRLARVVTDIDTTISQIRTAVFALGDIDARTGPEGRRRVLEVVDEVEPLLPARPAVRFHGPVDAVLDGEALGDVLAVVREALTNVARHARATAVEVDLTADGHRVELVIEDDGVGIGEPTRRSGLANLRARAERHHGILETGGGGRGGTRLRWWIVLP